MNKMMQAVRNFWNDESGATAVEYGLMVALIAGVIIAGVTLLGGNLNTLFNNFAGVISSHTPAAS